MITLDQEQRLGRKAYYFLLSRKITGALVFCILTIALSLMHETIGSFIGTAAVSYAIMVLFFLTLVLFAAGFLISVFEYRSYTFSFGEFGVKIQRGIFSKKEISIPYRQIQDVTIERNFGQIMLGLSKLIMITAGHADAGENNVEAVLEPIDKNLAEEILDLLQRKIGVQVVSEESAPLPTDTTRPQA